MHANSHPITPTDDEQLLWQIFPMHRFITGADYCRIGGPARDADGNGTSGKNVFVSSNGTGFVLVIQNGNLALATEFDDTLEERDFAAFLEKQTPILAFRRPDKHLVLAGLNARPINIHIPL